MNEITGTGLTKHSYTQLSRARLRKVVPKMKLKGKIVAEVFKEIVPREGCLAGPGPYSEKHTELVRPG